MELKKQDFVLFFLYSQNQILVKNSSTLGLKNILFFEHMDAENIGCLLTWAAFNSLVTDSVDVSICQGMPLYPGSPTDWTNLYSALKMAQGINVAVTGNKKTIITLDLQLYSKAMQLREKKRQMKNFFFKFWKVAHCFCNAKMY